MVERTPVFGSARRMVARVAAVSSWAVVGGCQPVENPQKETELDDVEESVVVATSLGQVRGVRESGVLHFRGMRYAEPPVGERRFLAPLASGPWAGTLDATRFPDRCTQPDSGLPGAPPGTPTSEDCLFLNIVTPSVTGGKRPVLFWIHGGGFTNGSANEYNGSMLAAGGDVVVVTVNYRLGLFGFLDLGSLGEEYAGSASNGLRDQVLALEWVRDNIADYGGDPGNVTIFGESAGGHSVHALLATPTADGLYHKAIAHSPGTADQPPTDLVAPLLAHLGEPREGLVDALRAMTANDLLAVQSTLPSVGAGVDGTVVTRATDAAIIERGARGVPLIAGTNRDEGTFFTALFATFVPDAAARAQMIAGMNPGLAGAVVAGRDPAPYLDALKARYPDADAKKIHEHIWGAMFLKAAMGSAASASAAGPGGWLYRFDLPTTVDFLGQDVGATHGAEIPFTFNRFNSDDPGALVFYDPEDPVVRDLSRRWSDTIIAFARTGEPNGAGLPQWPRYAAESRQTLVLDGNPRVEADLNREERELWEGVLDGM